MTTRLAAAKMWALVKRDFRIATSYRLDFLLTTVGSLFMLTSLYFIGIMIDPATPGLVGYRGGYFPFVLVGYGFYQYFQLSLSR